jgi:ATP-dependent helicase STH1/SNF2
LFQATCIAELRKATDEHPELGEFDDAGSFTADGPSTAGVSGAGTPLASSGGQPKLKLTFNAGGANGSKGTSLANGGSSGEVSDDE